MYKITRKSFKGDMVELQSADNATEKPKWYFLDEKVQTYSKNLKKGDTVNAKFIQKGKDSVITYITKGGESDVQSPASTDKPTSSYKSYPKYQSNNATQKPAWGQKSPEESERITRLSVLSSTVAIVAALKEVTVENVYEITEGLFDALLSKVKETKTENLETVAPSTNASEIEIVESSNSANVAF
jgi:hypothetical protein